MEDYPCNNEIEHVEKSFQVVTYSTICIGLIEYNNHDVITVEVTMKRQNFQILINPEIKQIKGVWSHFQDSQISKLNDNDVIFPVNISNCE